MEFLELTFSRHDTCNLLCDTSLALARFSPTRRYTGNRYLIDSMMRWCDKICCKLWWIVSCFVGSSTAMYLHNKVCFVYLLYT